MSPNTFRASVLSKIASVPADQRSTDDLLLHRYLTLCAERDARYEMTNQLQVELDKANAEEQAARNRALELANKMERIWGADWIAMKKQIGRLADPCERDLERRRLASGG